MLKVQNRYSSEFKTLAVSKFLSRGSRTVKSVSSELGVPSSMIYSWVQNYSSEDPFMNDKPRAPQSLTGQDKAKLVFEYERLAEESRGEFLRSHGVTSEQIALWKQMMTEGIGGTNSSENELKGKVKQLEKDLARKEKALAEAAALLILQKKIQTFYGSEDE